VCSSHVSLVGFDLASVLPPKSDTMDGLQTFIMKQNDWNDLKAPVSWPHPERNLSSVVYTDSTVTSAKVFVTSLYAVVVVTKV